MSCHDSLSPLSSLIDEGGRISWLFWSSILKINIIFSPLRYFFPRSPYSRHIYPSFSRIGRISDDDKLDLGGNTTKNTRRKSEDNKFSGPKYPRYQKIRTPDSNSTEFGRDH
mmetsp:Transcript_26240/g.30086  ORF Transcript_26240/g.30086 Transcript_26240/m.30086 type:complete len:112 (+) Transcript_26240:996-1331(+)